MKKLSKLLLVLSFALSISSSAYAVTVVANAEVVSESTKEIASNILLSFFIIPPFKRFYKSN